MNAKPFPYPKANWLLGHLPGELVAHAETGAGGLIAHLITHRTIETPVLVPAVAEPLLVWIATGAARVEERADDGGWRRIEVGPGDLFVVDSDEPYELRWQALGESFQALHVYLSVALVEAAALALYGQRQRPSLREPSGARDAWVSALLEVMHREMTRVGVPTTLLLEGVGQALAVCVLRTFTDSNVRIERRGALPSIQLRAVVQHMRDHLAEPFSLIVLSSIAGLSPFHFSRVFKRSAASSPRDYFIGLRVKEARRLLRETTMPVIEVGLAVGYESPSHFAQMFRRATGMTPTQFRGASSS
ncbi:helix-turn-helix transcriptional regulator [Acetobacter sacchari]|uniref:Helix-turn-helix transcriptional regulator n=1 Tax=Acetobacter sacchari TaxID=2661687 RepID=A0ABS3LSQ0_9PROT|nr:helix-turn-helix domain-containing protein [Acetobacter sacchari]MBO1358923.1 helix-turn-helix transcriptional regulator [Acetobacter sacchari]